MCLFFPRQVRTPQAGSTAGACRRVFVRLAVCRRILQNAQTAELYWRSLILGSLPETPEKPRRKQIRFPVGEIHEIATEHQKHRYVFYEGKIPIAGTNTQPLRIVAWATWQTDPQHEGDPLMRYGIGLPKDPFSQVAWLCCRDEKPTEYDKQLIVYEDGSAALIIADDNILTFPKSSYTISKSQRYRFKYPDTEPTINQ